MTDLAELASSLSEELAEAEARVAQLRRQIAAGPCLQFGHDWKFIGGRNAGCGPGCDCSVPVHECSKCGDCDYGQNAEADETRTECLALRAHLEADK